MTNTLPAGDRNQAFTAERRGQLDAAADRRAATEARIAAGTLVPLGGNRFQVNDLGQRRSLDADQR
jgi:hypothetical protein